MKQQQASTLAQMMYKLRQKLNSNELQDKAIGWTTRFNPFINDENRPAGYIAFQTDGEGLIIEEELVKLGSSLKVTVDYVNIMFYDVVLSSIGAKGALSLDDYKVVLDSFAKYLSKDQIVMGFAPGGEAIWEGMTVDM